ncbi:PAS domain-containing sensor histidine kinase, partial [Hymenobacter crusticola]
TGIFAFYRDTFLSGRPGQYEVNYSFDGLDNFFLLSAQRSGELLLVSFSDTAEQQSVAAEALRRSQAREQAARVEAEARRTEWQRVFEQAPIALARLRSPAFVVEWANARMGQIWGRPLDQIIGRPHFEALPDLAGQGFEAVFAGVLQTGKPYYFQELLVHIEQAHQPYQGYFNISYQPAYDELGYITGVMSSAIEVTDQVRARQQVQALNGELAALNAELHASNEEYLAANTALSRIQQQLQQLNQELETRVQLRTQVAQTAQAEAEHQRQQLYQVLMQLPASVATNRGPEHVYDLVNPRYQQLFRSRALRGLAIRQALPELQGQGVVEKLDRVYQTGEAYLELEQETWVDVTDTGHPEQRYYNILLHPLRDAHGQVDGLLNFAYDVTEHVRTRQQLQQLNEELHHSNNQLRRTNVDLDTFIYTASHDLKAPITNIESILLALQDTLPAAVQQDELVASLLAMLGQTVTRFQFTIAQLTDITRLQLAHTGPLEPVVLAQVVADVALDITPLLLAAGTQFTVDIAPDLVVSFSPANLRSVVYNLLSNAIKYRSPNRPSVVQVRAEPGPAAVVFIVQDNGLGMSEAQQSQLFGLFQRLHTHVEGTGVGLYISKRLVENVGGTITVESQPNVGTTFTVTFPL